MTVKEGRTLRQVKYLNDRPPTLDRMTAEEKAIVTAAIVYVLAREPSPHELYVALEEAVLAYVPSMGVKITEEEKEE